MEVVLVRRYTKIHEGVVVELVSHILRTLRRLQQKTSPEPSLDAQNMTHEFRS